jgi:hypothetical protein
MNIQAPTSNIQRNFKLQAARSYLEAAARDADTSRLAFSRPLGTRAVLDLPPSVATSDFFQATLRNEQIGDFTER